MTILEQSTDGVELEAIRAAFRRSLKSLIRREFAQDIRDAMGEAALPRLEPLLWDAFKQGWKAKGAE